MATEILITIGDFDLLVGAKITGMVESDARPRRGFSIEKDGVDYFVWPTLEGFLEVEPVWDGTVDLICEGCGILFDDSPVEHKDCRCPNPDCNGRLRLNTGEEG